MSTVPCGGGTAFGMAITYRMRGMFPGTVTRTHPQWIEPCLVDSEGPPMFPGAAVKLNDTGEAITLMTDSDDPTAFYGVAVRAYPWQPFVINIDGSQTCQTPVWDVLMEGYIGVLIEGVPSNPQKRGQAFVTANSTFSGSTGAGPLVMAHWNGMPDSGGVAEMRVTIFQG